MPTQGAEECLSNILFRRKIIADDEAVAIVETDGLDSEVLGILSLLWVGDRDIAPPVGGGQVGQISCELYSRPHRPRNILVRRSS